MVQVIEHVGLPHVLPLAVFLSEASYICMLKSWEWGWIGRVVRWILREALKPKFPNSQKPQKIINQSRTLIPQGEGVPELWKISYFFP